MSDRVFVDTFYFLALLNRRDSAHARAVDASRAAQRTFISTEYVMLELGDALSRAGTRSEFIALYDALVDDPAFSLLPVDANSFAQGITLYRERIDKDWSLTDCISFATMTKHGLKEALTGDRHFEQAGFRALLK